MVRNVGLVLVFLVFCRKFAFIRGKPYNLKGNKTDACFRPSQKATAECLQQLIENYYGKSFTKYCPDFPQVLAESRCKGCPWDHLDPDEINPDISEKYREASNETELFHETRESCRISKYVRAFGTYRGVANYVVTWALGGSIPILFATAAIVQYTSGGADLALPHVFGLELPEWMFMGAVWISFNIGIIMLSISEEYYRYCDTAASSLALVIARDLSYFVLVYYSLCRGRRLRVLRIENKRRKRQRRSTEARGGDVSLDAGDRAEGNRNATDSWYMFVSEKEGRPWREYIRSKKAVAFCSVYGNSAVVLVLCVFGTYTLTDFANREGLSVCFLPSVNGRAKGIEISKLALEPFAYMVYSFGASTRNKVTHNIRHGVFVLIAAVCITITVLTVTESVHRHYDNGFLFWGVPIRSGNSGITAMAHALTVSFFGLFEPVRY